MTLLIFECLLAERARLPRSCPGRLTRDYIAGRRASYVSPIARFLFATFLMFAMIQVTGSEADVFSGRPIGEAIGEHVSKLAILRHSAGNDVEKASTSAIIAKLQRLRDDGLRYAPSDFDLEMPKISTHVGWLDGMVERAIANPALLSERVEGYAHKYAWVLIPLLVLRAMD